MSIDNETILLSPQLTEAQIRGLAPTRRASLIADAPVVAKKLLGGDIEDRADASIVFDSVAKVMAIAIRDHDSALFGEGLESLVEIWKVGNFEALLPLTPPDFEASLWEALAINLYALGGLLVAEERWADLRTVAAQAPTGGSAEKSWLRQGQVASSRANQHYPEESVFSLASDRVRTLDPSINGEHSKDLLACFDLIAGMVISESGLKGFYPNAAELSEQTIEPFVIEKLRDGRSSLRAVVYPGDDRGLATALGEYDRMARLQAALARHDGQSWLWRGFSDARTLLFIAEAHILEEWR